MLKYFSFLILISFCFEAFSQDEFDEIDEDFFAEEPTEENIEDIEGTEINAEFSGGAEEADLLKLSEKLSYKLSDSEWEDAKANANVVSTYTVQSGDWLFKISKKLFGTGHYYPKIWALNPYITNPHQIEPGMLLVFDSSESGATISFGGSTAENPIAPGPGGNWQSEKRRLLSQGVQVDYASPEMQGYLDSDGNYDSEAINNYRPPSYDHLLPRKKEKSLSEGGITVHNNQKLQLKQGYSINTFISDNEIESFGEIVNSINNTRRLDNHNKIFMRFHSGAQQKGDTFSIFRTLGDVDSDNSDRAGYKTVITAHAKLIKKIEDLWEARLYNVTHEVERGDGITNYTPKIKKIRKKYTAQKIEAFIVSTFDERRKLLGVGDIVYLDRGRSDGVRIGNVFGVFGNRDNFVREKIVNTPLYYKGELTVIGITNKFATALVTQGNFPLEEDDFSVTISAPYNDDKDVISNKRVSFPDEELADDDFDLPNGDDLDNFNDDSFSEERPDIDLDPSDDNFDLKDQDIDGTEDLDDNFNQPAEDGLNEDGVDLKGLEDELGDIDDLANQGTTTSEVPNESIPVPTSTQSDEDFYDEEVQGTDLEAVSEDLEGIERRQGKKYLDEDINEQENPYGLTESDLEEVDELLNFESLEE